MVFGKQGETCAAHLRKGDTALLEGRLKTRSWEVDGVRRYRTEIIAERVVFGPKTAPGGGQDTEPPLHAQATTSPGPEIGPEDIPF